MNTQGIEFITDYMRDTEYRHALNALTMETFGFDFEDWYTKGFYMGTYIPYSFIKDGRIISNASANLIDFTLDGVKKRYVQIGTVMTRKEYRRQGLAAELVRRIIQDYRDKCDDIYLFANASAVGFYETAGFHRGMQYRCSIDYARIPLQEKDACLAEHTYTAVDPKDAASREKYLQCIRNMYPNARLEANDFGLMAFWTEDMENIYYCEADDCYVYAETANDTLYLNSIIAHKPIKTMDVLKSIGIPFQRAVINYTPMQDEAGLFTFEKLLKEDTVFFHLGDGLNCTEEKKLMFPICSHA